MIRNKILGAIAIIIGGAMVIGVFTFAHICTDMSTSNAACHDTRVAAVILGLCIVIVGLLLLCLNNRFLGRLFSLLLAAGGIAGLLIPTFIAPVCRMAKMQCQVSTKPFILMDSAALLVIALIFLIVVYRKWGKSKEIEAVETAIKDLEEEEKANANAKEDTEA